MYPHLNPMANMLLKRAESSIRLASTRLREARSLREVRDRSQVSLPPELRAIRHTIPGYKMLLTQAEEKALAMVKEQLEGVARYAETGRSEEVKDKLAQLRQREWVFLQGNFPRALSYASYEAKRIIFQTEARISSIEPAPADQNENGRIMINRPKV